MSLKTALLILLSGIALAGYAQNKKLDSLQKALETGKEDTGKVKTYFEIIKIVRRYSADSARDWANKQLLLSKKLNYTWGIGKAYNSLGLIERTAGNMDISTANFFLSAAVFNKSKDYDNLVTAYINAADNYIQEGKNDSALILCRIGQRYNQLVSDSSARTENKMYFYSGIGSMYLGKLISDSALIYIDSSVQIARQTGDKNIMADNIMAAAGAYQSVSKNEIALIYLREAAAIYKKNNMKYQLVQTLSGMAISHYSLHQYDSSVFYTRESMDLAAELNDSTRIGQNFMDMGLAMAGMRRFPEALAWYQEALHLNGKWLGNFAAFQVYQYTGEALWKMGNYTEAITVNKKALQVTDSLNYKARYECSNIISLCYEELKDYKNALYYARESRSAEHLYFNTEQARTINELNIKYETVKSEERIKLLSAENEVKTLLASRQQQQKSFAFAAMAAILLSGGYGFYRYRRRKKIQGRQALLNERLRISSELHDEVGATLSGIAMYSHLTKEQMKTGQTAEIEKSLNVMQQSSAQMVDKLNDIVWLINPEQDSLQKLVERLEEYAGNMAAIKNMQVRVRVPEKIADINLPVESRRNIYLFCKEAINNAVKYSNATTLELTIKETDGKIEFSVSDDGRGFDAVMVRRGNGLENMQKRADEIGAKLVLESKINEGASVSLQCKIT